MSWDLVYRLVKQIPRGRVLSYGALAKALRLPGGARTAGRAMAATPSGKGIPWHRVVGERGKILIREPYASLQKKLLESEGVKVGITKTLDGKHPCDLCLSIAKNKQTEKKQSSQLAAAKIYLVAPAQRWRLQPPRYSWRLRTTIASLVGCDSSPPVPPPRVS